MNKIASESASPFMPVRGIIRSIIPMVEDNVLFQISLPENSLEPLQPGQFVQLWVPGVGESPISVCSAYRHGKLELTVRKVGRVTSALLQMKEGDWVGLRGPYGVGFPVEEFKGKNVCLIAGGLGAAPMRSVCQYLLDRREEYGRITLIYGMRHSNDLLFRAELTLLLARKDLEVFIAAEELDGPELPPIALQLGRVTDMVKLAHITPDFEVAVCGPPIMYSYVIDELKKKGVAESNIWLSLERQMKCGIGKCGHCFVGGLLTCKAGPVFNLSKLRLYPEVVECKR